jgi:hypothetical protein
MNTPQKQGKSRERMILFQDITKHPVEVILKSPEDMIRFREWLGRRIA